MALDMAKYRLIFLEEASDHLGEIGRALLELEKETSNAEAIDTLFRMAHSIKSMAASLGYDAVADLAHRMEDRMEGVRSDGRVRSPEELALLFRGLEGLEAMVEAIAHDQPVPPVDEALLAELALVEVEGEAQGEAESESGSADPIVPDAVGGEPKKARR